MEDIVTSPGRTEEAKLKARYPHLGKKPGGSNFFKETIQLPTAAPGKTEVTGDHIPIPQGLPQRKPPLVASKLSDCLKELNCMNLLIPIISP
ncbi:hypothetical protein FD755_024361 [Muntiacus reevesi]|uniref:Uncharacterized protein n=1 Tax=Muntiacus reevesi TaxID=9886 RepID=A0A5N3VA76_MUNRE|nr:hypothetical protein FD755_024361 [Muntiacus reevesi]